MQNNNPWKNFNPFIKTLPIPPSHYTPMEKGLEIKPIDSGMEKEMNDFLESVEYWQNKCLQEYSNIYKKQIL